MKTALVTGGTRGIGLSTAQKFINQGWNVYITSRKQENLEAVLSENSQLKGFVARADDLAAAAETCEKIINETGSLDVLINNAGTNPSGGSLLDVDLSAVQKTWDVNLMGPLMWTREAVKSGLKESVLNVCSVGGIKPSHYMGAYNISKAGLIYMTKQLAMELAPDIRVNCISPSLTDTGMTKSITSNENIRKAIELLHPIPRIGQPSDHSKLAALLLNNSSNWITGQIFNVDGGRSTLRRKG